MKIQAYLACYNEADILPHVLRHLREQGVSVRVLDGSSSDGSYAIALREADSVESFPPQYSPVQCCTDILHRVEELAAESDASWVLYTDCDEWRRSPVEGETLAQGIARVDAAGFNAIDFEVFQFYPTSGGWTPAANPETYFHYYNQTDCISRIPNRKLWKNTGRVTLADGGHGVTFRGIRVCPEKFVMKHYPFRTPAQARAKIETRLARRCKEEHDRGWGVHYDQYPPDFSYCWDATKLLRWEDTRSPRP
jgi:glycosyltransferase involved in cell wall biosynthesis